MNKNLIIYGVVVLIAICSAAVQAAAASSPHSPGTEEMRGA